MIKILILDAIIFYLSNSREIKKKEITENSLDSSCIGHYSPGIGHYVK